MALGREEVPHAKTWPGKEENSWGEGGGVGGKSETSFNTKMSFGSPEHVFTDLCQDEEKVGMASVYVLLRSKFNVPRRGGEERESTTRHSCRNLILVWRMGEPQQIY